MKIAIIVEGTTETAFKPFLQEFLRTRIPDNMPELDFVRQDGRIPKEGRLKSLVERKLTGDKADAVIALTDVSTGTNDFKDAADAKTKMRRWVKNERFYPHAAQYEVEAWLLPFWKEIQDWTGGNLTLHGKPESINHTHPPSERIKAIVRQSKKVDGYVKARDAYRILAKAQRTRSDPVLLVAADACPELKAFLNTILELSGGQTLP